MESAKLAFRSCMGSALFAYRYCGLARVEEDRACRGRHPPWPILPATGIECRLVLDILWAARNRSGADRNTSYSCDDHRVLAYESREWVPYGAVLAVGELCFCAQLRNMAAKCLNTGIFDPANNSLERTQPKRDFMYDVAVLRRSARGRWAAKRHPEKEAHCALKPERSPGHRPRPCRKEPTRETHPHHDRRGYRFTALRSHLSTGPGQRGLPLRHHA